VNICVVHNRYREPGGEEQVFAAEVALLKEHNHSVVTYVVHNDDLPDKGPVALAAMTVWNPESGRILYELFKEHRIDVAHFHNTLPIISPAGYYAARRAGAAVVQTIHNYRLVCAGAMLTRNGHTCEDCLGKVVPWPAVAHGCYRGSRAASGAVAAMLTAHRLIGTWSRAIDVYIALTGFGKSMLVAGGIPEHRIVVKPNFIDSDSGMGTGDGNYALLVGRLTPEKGVMVALDAWVRHYPGIPLKIVGDGPLRASVEAAARSTQFLEWLGRQPRNRVLELLRSATMLIAPSIWYEGLPLVIVEAFAAGLPVVASDHGSLATIVANGRTGFLFRPGDALDLAKKAGRLHERPDEREQMRNAARAEYVQRYTAEQNYENLLAIYAQAITSARAHKPHLHAVRALCGRDFGRNRDAGAAPPVKGNAPKA
jgi:glycosyltransferase involved in cell wall biosynthesis